ncbi:MAG: glycosyltransferase family 2 protein [Ekhidna sp.]|nr:glycosyltransferase family 2 protein [Ekhidna sp.]
MPQGLSIVIPVYNEEESIPELLEWTLRIIDSEKINAEILLIDDGSTDESWQVILNATKKDLRVIGLRFNRNYGKSAALQTGFDHAKGEIVITMDADLQDNPNEIPELIKIIETQNLHIVSGWKRKRHDPLSKTIPSKFFNWVTGMISGITLHDFNCGLKAYRSEVIKNIHVYGEMHRYIPVIAKWNGFKEIGEKVVEHRARKYGKTKYGMKRFVTGFLDLLSVTFVLRFKKNPMHFFGALGTLSFLSGFLITFWIIVEKLYRQFNYLPRRDVVDQPLFFLALVALIVGTQLFLTGFLAELLIQGTQRKGDYLISEKVNVS